MDLSSAIAAFNAASQHLQIDVVTTRDGRVIAKLPSVQREIIVGEGPLSPAKVGTADILWLCEEARRAGAPAWALLSAALQAMAEIAAAAGAPENAPKTATK